MEKDFCNSIGQSGLMHVGGVREKVGRLVRQPNSVCQPT
jgi:hypothetical protein